MHFLGHRDDVPRLMQHFDLLCLSSAYEGQSNAIMEAMAAGKPVVAYETGSHGEIIVDGHNGRVIENSNQQAFNEAIRELEHCLSLVPVDSEAAESLEQLLGASDEAGRYAAYLPQSIANFSPAGSFWILQYWYLGPDTAGLPAAEALEVVFDWHPLENWKLQTVYSYIDVEDELDSDSSNDQISNALIEGSTPEHQLSIRTSHDLSSSLSLNLWLYYVDQLNASAYSVDPSSVDSYSSFNFRLDWKPRQNIQLSLVGLNLNEDSHAEFIGEDYITITELERSAYLQLSLDF